jgi:D-3-phosphoglycerate dehydrogenase
MTPIAITSSTFDLSNLPPELSGCEVRRNTTGKRLDRDGVVSLIGDGVEGVIAGLEPFDSDVLARTPDLRAISRIGTGLDNVDLVEAERRGIRVLNTPDAPTVAVAEFAVGLMLAGLRHIVAHHRSVVAGGWQVHTGGLLSGRTVGLVGAGRIGRAVADRLVPFGAHVQATDPHLEQSSVALPLVDLQTLLATSDVISLHVPGGADTHHLIGVGEIAAMKAGAMLINTARGGLVDEGALVEALLSGRIAFAAIDAFAVEPYSGALTNLDNVLLTPHVGSNTVETRRAMEREAAQHLALALGLMVE